MTMLDFIAGYTAGFLTASMMRWVMQWLERKDGSE